MKTLVLGHGKRYTPRERDISKEKYDALPYKNPLMEIRCSPLDVNKWYFDEHTSVDIEPEVIPDIVYDLRKRPWSFAESDSYDRVIDTCGIAFFSPGRKYNEQFMEEVTRVLKHGGLFYGRDGTYRVDKEAESKLNS
jgi:hypothetical protein